MDPAAVVLRPARLGLESVAVLARDVFHAEPDEGFCAACLEATGGNPLYLRALLITLESEGVAPTADAAARVQEVGPGAGRAGRRAAPLAAAAGGGRARAGDRRARADGGARSRRRAGGARALRRRRGRGRPRPLGALAARADARLRPPRRARRGLRGDRDARARRGASPRRRRCWATPAPSRSGPRRTCCSCRPPATRSSCRSCAAPRGARSRAARRARRSSTCGGRSPSRRPRAARGEVLGELGTIERSVDLTAAIEHLREAVALIDEPHRYGDVVLQYARAVAYAGLDSAEAVEMYRAAIHSAVGANRPELVEVATAELINASWAEAEFLATAKTLLVDVRDDRLSGGFASDFLLALLAHYEVRRGVDRERDRPARPARAHRRHARAASRRRRIYYALDALRAAGELDAALAGYGERPGAGAQARRPARRRRAARLPRLAPARPRRPARGRAGRAREHRVQRRARHGGARDVQRRLPR